MPYIAKGQCVYKKNGGAKVGCTKGSVKRYLAALHANIDESDDSTKEEEIKEVIKETSVISESYKKRLQELAGIPVTTEVVLTEVTDAERNLAFAGSNKRVPYNKDLMIQAIKEGREIGILFQSDNEKYKMPVAKYRIIRPVALGISKAGNSVIRILHVFGQSESEARKTGIRSQEAENVWRLIKASNIKSMWMTGTFFYGPLESYNRADKGMLNVELAADFNKIRKFQQDLVKQEKTAEKAKEKAGMIKKIGFPEKPLDKTRTGQQPIIQKPSSIKGNKR